MKTTRIVPHRCFCGYVSDRSSAVMKPDAVPIPGALTVCIRCARVYEFGPALELVAIDVATLPEETRSQVRIIQWAVQRVQRTRS